VAHCALYGPQLLGKHLSNTPGPATFSPRRGVGPVVSTFPGFSMKVFLALPILIGAGLISELAASAQKSSNLRADQIQISYVAPKNSVHEKIFELLKQRLVLEKLKGLLSALRLPRTLVLKVEGCDGESNAWYGDDNVTVCYEYFEDILRNAPKETTAAGVTRTDAIVGPALEVFLHEIGHAVFDYLSVPILGREEDAADQFAAYVLLQFDESDARRLIYGVGYSYNIDASKPSTKKNPFADEHGLPAQRFYNVLCMAYGSDPKLFVDLVDKGYLPKERAEGCADEYGQVIKALNKLIGPYIDQTRAKQVRAKQWLRFDVQ
jgi:Putative metallopeptidase